MEGKKSKEKKFLASPLSIIRPSVPTMPDGRKGRGGEKE